MQHVHLQLLLYLLHGAQPTPRLCCTCFTPPPVLAVHAYMHHVLRMHLLSMHLLLCLLYTTPAVHYTAASDHHQGASKQCVLQNEHAHDRKGTTPGASSVHM